MKNPDKIKKAKLNHPLYCITAEKYSLGRSNIEVVKAMIDAGVKIIQYREKEKKMNDKFRECLAIRKLTQKHKVTFIVNDDVHLAIAVHADGVHIGQDDLPVEIVRSLTGEKMIIGVSTHSPKQAKDAVKSGADYIGVGPIYPTYTKDDVCRPVGLKYLDYIVKNINIPFVTIGGIKEHNIDDVLSHGAKCIALVTEIVGSKNIPHKIKSILQKIKRCRSSIY